MRAGNRVADRRPRGLKQAFFKGLFDGDSDSVKFDQSGSFLARVKKLYDPATLAAATAGGGSEEIELTDLADVGLDDEVTDPFEEVIEAGDESQDQMEPGAEGPTEPAPVLAIAPAAPEPATPAGETVLVERQAGRTCRPRTKSVTCSHSFRSAAGTVATLSSRLLPRPPRP